MQCIEPYLESPTDQGDKVEDGLGAEQRLSQGADVQVVLSLTQLRPILTKKNEIY